MKVEACFSINKHELRTWSTGEKTLDFSLTDAADLAILNMLESDDSDWQLVLSEHGAKVVVRLDIHPED